MKSLQEFLNEVRKQYLYHTTSSTAFHKIYKDGYIRSDKGGGFRSWVSFTRSSHYMMPQHPLDGRVRFVYDYDKIKQRYKTQPKADLSVVSTSRSRLSQIESKYESEELVKSPILLSKKHGLVSIETDARAKKIIEGYIKLHEEQINNTLKKIEMLEKNMFWHDTSGEWREITSPKQKRLFTRERYENSLKSSKEGLQYYKDILNNPIIKWGVLN